MPVQVVWTQSGAWYSYADVMSGFVGSGLTGSGLPVTYSRGVIDDTLAAGETISGGAQCVTLVSGNTLAVAMAGSGLRLPPLGVVTQNYLSGAPNVQVSLLGRLLTPYSSGWSGSAGASLYVGSGGMITNAAAFASGQFLARIGVAVSGGLFVNPSMMTVNSGFAQSGGIVA